MLLKHIYWIEIVIFLERVCVTAQGVKYLVHGVSRNTNQKYHLENVQLLESTTVGLALSYYTF